VKLPRGVSADRLIAVLKGLGYLVVRQKGSHCRLKHPGPPIHSVTVPMHNPFKTGTLHGLLVEVGERRGTTVETLTQDL